MLQNYLTVAIRSLVRHRGQTILNVAGLALGLACCLLILLFVHDEWSYDRYHANADRVYRVARAWYDEAGAPTTQFARISPPIGPALAAEFPEVQRAVRIMGWDGTVSVRDRHFQADRFYFAEAGVVDLFTIPFVAGDPSTALAEPYTVVLTETAAARYFGDRDPIGETLRFENGPFDLRVSGVVADPPSNTHWHYDALASLATLEAQPWSASWATSWGGDNNFATYALLADGTDPAALEAKLPAFMDAHYDLHFGAAHRLFLQPLTAIHLHSHLDAELEPNGRAAHVTLFSAVALLILLVACFNFMNLATARATVRAREVGMRKVLGARRPQLVRQFLAESTLLSVAALVLALVLAELLTPLFNTLSGKTLSVFSADLWFAVPAMFGLALFVGILAGSYPAFVLSGFQPLAVLKSGAPGSWRSRFRATLVVAQFTVTIVLFVGVGVILQQLAYVRTADLGLDEDQLVTFVLPPAMRSDFEATRRHLLEHPGVQAVTASEYIPSGQLLNTIDVFAEVDGQVRPFESLALLAVDHDFTTTYGIDIVAGRTFSKDVAGDSLQGFVLNEAAVRSLGWASPADAVGKSFALDSENLTDRRGTVIGVMRDFHFESLRERISPMVLYIRPGRYLRATVRLAGDDVRGTLAFLDAWWRTEQPAVPFTYTFVDQRYAALYQAEERLGRIIGALSVLAVCIAGLGLFGLATFATSQRTREIGVRKVLGASVAGIVLLLTRDVVRFVALAFVLAVPIAYAAADRWLHGFAYRVEMSPGTFLRAGLAALGVALLTVSYQAVKGALADPVKSLRYE